MFPFNQISPRLVRQPSPCSHHQHMVQPELQKLSILSLSAITGIFTLNVYGATVRVLCTLYHILFLPDYLFVWGKVDNNNYIIQVLSFL